MKQLSLFVVLCMVSLSVFSQVLTPEQKKVLYRDSFLDYDDTFDIDSIRNFQQRLVVQYPPIREADVMWSKRVWRDIEVSEKLNHILYYPIKPIEDRKSLFEILRSSYQEGLIQPFATTRAGTADEDDEFTNPISIEECNQKNFGTTEELPLRDENDEIIPNQFETIEKQFEAFEVVKYRLKEDWYFDKQHSQMRVKIIGIKPYVRTINENGNTVERGTAWFYFPEVRHVLVNYEVFNPGNETQRITFDDLFTKRMFSSHIVKEENVYTREIKDYKTNKFDAYLEGERIENEIKLFEHDLWSY